MSGAVYEVDPLETIRAFATEQLPYTKLTMPEISGLRPFFTFQCSEEEARRISTRSKRVM
jgi:hypothetical protein